jgi:hypothetical protein
MIVISSIQYDANSEIACVTVGDLRKKGRNSLVVLSGEGKCYLFDIVVYFFFNMNSRCNVLFMCEFISRLYLLVFVIFRFSHLLGRQRRRR